MASGGAEASGSGPAESPLRPRRRAGGSGDPVLIVCRCFAIITAAAALLYVAANVLSAVYSLSGGADILGGVFRCYAAVFSVFVAVLETECEWTPIINLWKLNPFSTTSLLGSVAVVTKAYPNVQRNELILLQEIATYMLLACGAVYIIAGVLCLGVLKCSRQHKETSQEQAVKDLEELEKRREELESLLISKRSETA